MGHNLWGYKESDRTEREHEQEKGKMNYFPNFQESEALSFIKAGIKKKIPHSFLLHQPVLESALALPDMQRVSGPLPASSAPLFPS